MKKVSILIVLFLISSYVYSQRGVRIGYVDTEYILQNLSEYEETRDQLEESIFSKIFDMEFPVLFSISLSISKKFSFSFLETINPIEVFPDPIIPKKTRFLINFISFFYWKNTNMS